MPLLELKILEIHSFPQFSPTCFDICWNFAYDFVLSWSVSIFVGAMPLLDLSILEIHSIPYFSDMLWHACIELKLYIWFCFTVLQIKFECRQFASIFVGVMPLVELRIRKIHSFPHFSLTYFDILIWNFTYDFVLLYYISSLSVVNLRQFSYE